MSRLLFLYWLCLRTEFAITKPSVRWTAAAGVAMGAATRLVPKPPYTILKIGNERSSRRCMRYPYAKVEVDLHLKNRHTQMSFAMSIELWTLPEMYSVKSLITKCIPVDRRCIILSSHTGRSLETDGNDSCRNGLLILKRRSRPWRIKSRTCS